MNGIKGIKRLGIALIATVLALLPATGGASPAAAQSGGMLLWAKTLGSANQDIATSVATDSAGNVFVGGLANGRNGFAAKYSSDGAPLWNKSFGNTGIHAGITRVNDIAVDSGGSAFVIGTFSGQTDFDPGPADYSLTSNGDEDVFVLKLDANGNFVWAVSFGGKQSDTGEAIFVDGRGFVYTTGSFEEEMDVDPDPDRQFKLYSEGDDDIFVVRYSNGGELRRAWSMGGNRDAIGRDIAVDAAGNVYIAGDFMGLVDLDHNNTSDERRSRGDEDIFVVKYNDNAGWVWSAVVGGLEEDERPSVAVDRAGNVYLTGTFETTVDVKAVTGQAVLVSRGQEDFFLVKLSGSGALLWAQSTGGPGSDRSEDVVVDGRGDAHVAGSFQASVDFDPGSETTVLTSAGSDDVFIARYGSTGFFYAARAFGGPQEDIGYGLARDAASNLVVAGSFQGIVDFDPSGGTEQRTAVGESDAFVTKLVRDETPAGDQAIFLPWVGAASVGASSLR